MSNRLMNFLMLVIGSAIGATVAWHIAKEKYALQAQEEIDSVKEVFAKRDLEPAEAKMKADKAKDKPGIVEYAAKLHEHGYTNYSVPTVDDVEPDTVNYSEKPYVIPPEDFGDLEEYEELSLTYYADQVLADENDELVEDVEDVVGFDSLSHFGDYEEDSVFVRNDRLKCYYEILLDQRTYSSVVNRKPHHVEE